MNKEDLPVLPSGVSTYDLLLDLQAEAIKSNKTIDSPFILTELLKKIGTNDIIAFQNGVKIASKKYKYYANNQTMNEIPTSVNLYPNGGAVKTLAKLLNQRKEEGILTVNKKCVAERDRVEPKHNYIGNYPCEDIVNGEEKVRNKKKPGKRQPLKNRKLMFKDDDEDNRLYQKMIDNKEYLF